MFVQTKKGEVWVPDELRVQLADAIRQATEEIRRGIAWETLLVLCSLLAGSPDEKWGLVEWARPRCEEYRDTKGNLRFNPTDELCATVTDQTTEDNLNAEHNR